MRSNRSPHYLFVALITSTLSSLTLADDCERLPLPAVSLKRVDVPLTLSTQYSYRTLNGMGAELRREGTQVLGLTTITSFVNFETKTQSYLDRTGRFECSSPQINVIYGINPMTVYVAKEFPVGTCAYQEIYAHELRHVKTYRDHLSGIEKDLASTLTQRFATGALWRGPVGQTQARIAQELDTRWLPYITREIERVKTAQALIDSPEEYARLANSCGGEIKKQIR